MRPERVTLLDMTVRIWFRIREIALFQCDEIRPWPPKEDIGRARQEKSRDQPRRQCALSAFNGRSQQGTIQLRRINQTKARYYKEKRCKTMGRLTEGFLREKKANSFSFLEQYTANHPIVAVASLHDVNKTAAYKKKYFYPPGPKKAFFSRASAAMGVKTYNLTAGWYNESF